MSVEKGGLEEGGKREAGGPTCPHWKRHLLLGQKLRKKSHEKKDETDRRGGVKRKGGRGGEGVRPRQVRSISSMEHGVKERGRKRKKGEEGMSEAHKRRRGLQNARIRQT